MMRAIHFYEGVGTPPGCLHTWKMTEAAIVAHKAEIHTTQMGFLSTSLFDQQYRIFVHPPVKSGLLPYEILLGTKNTCTSREISMGNNLFNMWMAGEFHAPRYGTAIPTAERLTELRQTYPKGTHIVLRRDLEDPFTVLVAGDTAVVEHVDDLGLIHAQWTNGSTLAIDPDIDSFEIQQCSSKHSLQVASVNPLGAFFKPLSVGEIQVTLEILPLPDGSQQWGIWANFRSAQEFDKSTRTIIGRAGGSLDDAIQEAAKLIDASVV
ncbi:MAG: DUF4314 domain-containing protein [Eubacterium sp.]|nr:DUF4314 domain-containing protein [Eubacterium sp.]